MQIHAHVFKLGTPRRLEDAFGHLPGSWRATRVTMCSANPVPIRTWCDAGTVGQDTHTQSGSGWSVVARTHVSLFDVHASAAECGLSEGICGDRESG